MFLRKSEDDPGEWVVMADDHTPAGWVSPGRKQPWGEQQWRGVVVGGTVACDDAYDRDDAAEQVMKVWREQEDADAEAEAEAAEAEQRAEPLRRGRPEIGPRFQMRLPPELRARLENEAQPGEKLADTIRRRLFVPEDDTLVTLRVPKASQAERLRRLVAEHGSVGIPFPNNTTGWRVVDENGGPVNPHAIPSVSVLVLDPPGLEERERELKESRRREELLAAVTDATSRVDVSQLRKLLPWDDPSPRQPVVFVTALVDRYGDECGILKRFAAGVQSATARRDGNVSWRVEPDGSQVTVTASSTGGLWTRRAWWTTATLDVAVDAHAEVRIDPVPGTGRLLVANEDRDHTLFHDGEDGTVIGDMAATWWYGVEARMAIRAVTSDGEAWSDPDVPTSPEAFLRTLRK